MVLSKLESELRTNAAQHIYLLEALLYVGVAILLTGAAAVAMFQSAAILWRGITQHQLAADGLLVLDQLLFVLMLVEILHTVRMSIHSKELMLAEPFLIVALIASIRRILVITLQAAKLTEGNRGTAEAATAFRSAMIELGLLGVLVVAFVFSIYLLQRKSRRERPSAE